MKTFKLWSLWALQLIVFTIPLVLYSLAAAITFLGKLIYNINEYIIDVAFKIDDWINNKILKLEEKKDG